MAKVRLIHWNGPEGRERRLRLAALGHETQFDDLEPQALGRSLRTNLPDAYVIDLSRAPSNGRQVGMALRTYKDTRHIPLVFVDGDPEKVKAIKALLPDATYTSWSRIKTALPKAIAKPPAAPVVPPSSIYTGRPVVAKLGIKGGMRVAVLGGPDGVAKILSPLPDKATLTAVASGTCDLFIAFLRSRRDLESRLQSVARHVTTQTLWLIWPKTASQVKTDLTGNVVRETGLATGWVDYKICSVDDTWSGLAFKRRK
jgi:CheY-like chemotaxis protein